MTDVSWNFVLMTFILYVPYLSLSIIVSNTLIAILFVDFRLLYCIDSYPKLKIVENRQVLATFWSTRFKYLRMKIRSFI